MQTDRIRPCLPDKTHPVGKWLRIIGFLFLPFYFSHLKSSKYRAKQDKYIITNIVTLLNKQKSVKKFDTTVQFFDTLILFKSVISLVCYGLQVWHDICIFSDRKE